MIIFCRDIHKHYGGFPEIEIYLVKVPDDELEDNADDSTNSGIVYKTLRKDNGDN